MATSYSDQMGKLPILSSRLNQYIFILYNYDNNSIHAHPLKSNQASEIIEAWKSCYDVPKNKCAATILHILDNECATVMKEALIENDVTFQLVPLCTHLRNDAEWSICTFKNHLCKVMTSCDPNLPTKKW